AWVLPIRGEVVVGVGSDTFINSLDAMTTPIVHAPTPTCPKVTSSGGYGGSYYDSSSGGGCGGGGGVGHGGLSFEDPSSSYDGGYEIDAGNAEETGVTVNARSTVGPYDVVQVHGKDEGSIVGWLRAHGYAVPSDIEPMLTKYVDEGFDFVAVRLRP